MGPRERCLLELLDDAAIIASLARERLESAAESLRCAEEQVEDMRRATGRAREAIARSRELLSGQVPRRHRRASAPKNKSAGACPRLGERRPTAKRGRPVRERRDQR
jgi:hypothetical protein